MNKAQRVVESQTNANFAQDIEREQTGQDALRYYLYNDDLKHMRTIPNDGHVSFVIRDKKNRVMNRYELKGYKLISASQAAEVAKELRARADLAGQSKPKEGDKGGKEIRK